jgi:hypothetical protein
LIREHRQIILNQLTQLTTGKRKQLQAVIDLSTLEKRGIFKGYKHLIHTLNRKRGVQWIVLYLVVGQWRVPWRFRIWRGRGHASPAKLAAKLLRTLPDSLKRGYKIRVLLDAGITSKWLLREIHRLGFEAIVGIQGTQRLTEGRLLKEVKRRGEQVFLTGMDRPVFVSWVIRRYKRQLKRFFVISTVAISGKHIVRWGKRRWQIEGFFKTVKHRFGIHRFGVGTLQGLYRWFLLSLTAYLLAYWSWLAADLPTSLDWAKAAQLALESLLPTMLVALLLVHIQQLQRVIPGIRIKITLPDRCKM